MKYIAVFCGSSEGNSNIFMKQAYETGKTIAQCGYGVVYGGARVGLMGAVADGALDNGSEAIGVIPTFLQQKELAHTRLTQNYIVDTMHERKAKMHELSDAVIVLPGGFGTLEEMFEILTWEQLDLHQKPVGILNVGGYYNTLFSFIDEMVDKKFLKPIYKDFLIVENNIKKLIDKMEVYVAPVNDKWFITK